MSKQDYFEVDGEIITALPNAMFKVKLNNMDSEIICHISGKIRQNFINIMVGDKVSVAVSKYDTSKGRIVFRYKKEIKWDQ